MKTLHDTINAVMLANKWEYAFACGYTHGKDDKSKLRPREIPTTETDDFALGYSRGYNETYNEDPRPLALQVL